VPQKQGHAVFRICACPSFPSPSTGEGEGGGEGGGKESKAQGDEGKIENCMALILSSQTCVESAPWALVAHG
jgi:hypothetical protein